MEGFRSGWIRTDPLEETPALWAAAQIGCNRESPWLQDVWLLISNMQPMGKKIGTRTFRKLTILSGADRQLWIDPVWARNYEKVTETGIELVRGREDQAFLQEAAACLVRFTVASQGRFDPYKLLEEKQPPAAAIFIDPWTVKGWHEADGILAPSDSGEITGNVYGRRPLVSPGNFTCISADKTYELPRWMVRYGPINTHQGGAPRRRRLFDLPGLLTGEHVDLYRNDLFVLAASDAERPVQRSHPTPDGLGWQIWRLNSEHDDRYEEGVPNMRNEFTSRPNPDFESMHAAPEKRRVYGLNGMDHEHANLMGLPQAFLRSGCMFFSDAIVGRAECMRSLPEAKYVPWHSERTAAWIMNCFRNASYVDDPRMAQAWHKKALSVMNTGLGRAGSLWTKDGPGEGEFPGDIKRPFFGWFRWSQPSYCAPWMGGLAMQAVASLVFDEVHWRFSGQQSGIEDIRAVLLDTYKFYLATTFDKDNGFAYKVSPYPPYKLEGGADYLWNASRVWLACGLGAMLALGNPKVFGDLLGPTRAVVKKLLEGHEHDSHGTTWANIWFQSARLVTMLGAPDGKAHHQPGGGGES
jgi:hypothetical protein